MPTAYLSPSQLRELTDVSVNPGAPQNGYPLVWNNTTSKWEASLLPYSSLSGAPALPIPVVSGGTGTQTGSITGTGALTFTPGGTTNPINLAVPKTTRVQVGTSATDGAVLYAGPVNVGYNPADISGSSYGALGARGAFGGIFFMQDGSSNGGQFFYDSNGLSFSNITNTTASNLRFNSGNARAAYETDAIRITTSNNVEFGRGIVSVLNTTASTSTTSGALTVAGGVGIAGGLHVGGGKVNFANLPTSDASIAVGDLWRDGNVVKVKTS